MALSRRLCLALAAAGILAAATAAAGPTFGWRQKVAMAGLGNPLTRNGQNPSTVYSSGLTGNVGSILVSRDRGETWETLAVLSGGANVKQVLVHPLDSLILLAAQEASPVDRILKSTDGGASWSPTLTGDLSYFGVPLESHPARPDTVYTMSGTALLRSTDFGSTWATINPATGFNAWCDAALRADSAGVMYVGDATSGIWKTTDGGLSFRSVYQTGGEIPMIAVDPADPAVAYATRYAGGGGFLRTTDFGETWLPIPQFAGINTWGVAIAQTQPQVILMGAFEPANPSLGTFLSRDGGASWLPIACGLGSSANYGMLVLDSAAAFVLQSDGLYALCSVDTSALTRGTIRGVVRDSAGAPRAADVRLVMRSCTWALDVTGQTDSAGRFSFDDLLPSVSPFIAAYDLDIAPEIPYAHLRLAGLHLDSSGLDLDALVPRADVLVVGEDSAAYMSYYLTALEERGVAFNAWNAVARGPGPVRRAGETAKRVLVYFTGTAQTPIDSATLRGLAAVLDSGVHLFLTGQNIAELNDSSALLRDYLGLAWGGNILFPYVTGTELCDGISFYTSVGDGAHNQTSRDILAAPGGRTVLEYYNGVSAYPAAFRFDSSGGGSRVVVAGFGFESVAGSTERSALLGKILGYLDGSVVVSAGEEEQLPERTALEQNYPNPFNPSTVIRFTMPAAGPADLRVYDLLGREVAVLADGVLGPGVHERTWNAPGAAGGVYYCRLSVGASTSVRKMLLLR